MKKKTQKENDVEVEAFDKFEEPKKVEVKQTEAKENKLATIEAGESGVIIGGSFEEQFRLARCFSASGLMPKGLNTPEKVFVALQFCHELKLPPMTSIGKIAVINGTASIFGDLPLALVQRSGMLESIKETCDTEDEIMKATCTVKRVKQEPVTRTFSMSDAKNAMLSGSDTYKKYPKRMLQLRARSWALKDSFPDILMGISIAEYDNHVTAVEGESFGDFEVKSKAEEMTEKFAAKEVVNV